MMALRLGRRSLLRGAGGIALALPWLEVMAPRRASAATGPRRLVIVFTPNGTNDTPKFMPTAEGAGFTLGHETEPLLSVKKDLLVLSGIDMKTANMNSVGDLHSIGMSHMLTCIRAIKADGYSGPCGGAASFAGGPSVDQKIARTIGTATRFPSLELGVESILGSRA